MPSGRMFGDRVAGKSRKYLANQTFTASYPKLQSEFTLFLSLPSLFLLLSFAENASLISSFRLLFLLPLHLPSQLAAGPRAASILLWCLIFGCKFVESYFFLTLSFKDPIRVMTGMKIQGCSDKYFGNSLCTNQAAFTLTIMFVMDLSLFFLDTFLW